MKIVIKDKSIDVSEISRVYPAALVKTEEGEISPISLEWAESHIDSVEISGFSLIFYFKSESKPTLDIRYENFDEMVHDMELIFEKLSNIQN
ncbi:hypothetical protein [Nitrosophilus alvini]|uniref:hypothetical protein n=1 Tax=Nitrosophilus alvini TaxID=2714855 RepID=UPI00190B73DA|nr:hypothetical protein [Nitrosophilus alvini]